MMALTIQNPKVLEVFEGYPPPIRDKLLALRSLIFETAAKTPGVGAIEETLKWGEPAYITRQTQSGSTVRIDWKPSKPNQYCMYFICTTTLVQTFRTVFPHDFKYDGNRALVFDLDADVPMDSLAFCIAAALTYRRERGSKPNLRQPGRR